jgi:hypothetical protein
MVFMAVLCINYYNCHRNTVKWLLAFMGTVYDCYTQTIITVVMINPLKPERVCTAYKKSVHTSNRTPHFTIRKINWLMPFKQIITVKINNRTKPINPKYKVTDSHSSLYIQFPFSFKGLKLLGFWLHGLHARLTTKLAPPTCD